MTRFALALTLSLFLSDVSANVNEKGLGSRYFKLVPEEEALATSGWAERREFNAKSLKALIWNIKKAELTGWELEFRKYSQNQDLILLQEAFSNNLFSSTIGSFQGFRWDMGISFLYKRLNDTSTGTMIGSIVEPTEALVRHSPDFEPIIDTPKSMTIANYPIEGRPEELLVISVHAINFTSTSSFKRHIDKAAIEIKEHPGPVLFAGDFNTWNKSRTNYLFNLCKKLGLKEVNFKNGHQRMKFGKYYLDHGFVRGVEVKRAEVLSESVGSDHKPMIVEMNIL